MIRLALFVSAALTLGSVLLLGAAYPGDVPRSATVAPFGRVPYAWAMPAALDVERADLEPATATAFRVRSALAAETSAWLLGHLWRAGYVYSDTAEGLAVFEAPCGRLAFVARRAAGTWTSFAVAFGQRPGAAWFEGACAPPEEFAWVNR